MPSVSPAQKRTMAARAHGWVPDNPKIAAIPVSVAKEYNAADQRASATAADSGHARRKIAEMLRR